uniref:RipA family octameric membrane protein n=1 Tax=Rahnella sp. RFA10(1/100) TaxID=2511202 RepID=UPI001020363B|nr:hypothetical protein [Rahnella sp. RFA10(1/100)]
MIRKETIIINIDDKKFFNQFFGKPINSFRENSRTHVMLQLALDKAHDIRKFEIDLYWKRATYFFAFFTVITAAFGFLFTSSDFNFYAPAAALIGSLFSVCFYFVNVGSKYWQCNWEYIIDKLEIYVTGNLYKVYFYDTKIPQRPSVSNINSLVSLIIIASWFLCFVASIIQTHGNNILYIALHLTAYALLNGLIIYFCSNSVKEKISKDDDSTRYFKFRTHTYQEYK